MSTLAKRLIECFERGNRIWLIGNGGSSAQASHFSEELISHKLPAIALNDPQVITALVNDFPPQQMFARYLEAVGSTGDLLIAFTTSGKSKNVLEAYLTAKQLDIEVIEWPHKKGKTTEERQNYQLKEMHKVYKEIVNYFK